MKKLMLLLAVLFSFSALTFAKSSVTPAKDVKKSAFELVKLDDSNTAGIMAQADEPAKQKIAKAISSGAETTVIEDNDVIIIIIIWDDGSVDIIILY